MKRSRFSEEQIIEILREAEAGSPIKAVCAAHNISTATYHAWKRKFGGMEVSEAKRLRALEEENSRLKRLLRSARAPTQRQRARVYRLLPAGLAKGLGDQNAYIKPGSPWENGHIESFHDKLRDECLNRELFGSLHEARVILESWRVEYNERRPHSALGYRTPNEYAENRTNRLDGGCAPPKPPAARRGRRSGGTKDQRHKVANKRRSKH